MLAENEIISIRKELGFEFSKTLKKYNISRREISRRTHISMWTLKGIETGCRGYWIDNFIKVIATLDILIMTNPSQDKLKKVYSIIRKFSSIAICEVIESTVSRQTGLSKEYFKSKTRKTECVKARYLCYKLEKRFTGMSLSEIGRRFNNADHASVLHGINTLNDLIATGYSWSNDYFKCEEVIEQRFKPKINEKNLSFKEQQSIPGTT